MKAKLPQQIKLSFDEIKQLRGLANRGELKYTKSYLSKILNERVEINKKTYLYLMNKITPPTKP